MKKILFLHGFYASGQCVPALALRDSFEGRAEVLTPDLPMHPKEAIEFISELIDRERPDLLVGNSCGSFYAQMLASITGIPALLGNPHFQMTAFLKQRIGEHQYKSPRKDGKQDFTINQALIDEFAEMEAIQFKSCNPSYKDRIWGLFGEQDTLAHFEPLFLEHYNQSFHFPGGHTPTAEEVHTWYFPLAEKMLTFFHCLKTGMATRDTPVSLPRATERVTSLLSRAMPLVRLLTTGAFRLANTRGDLPQQVNLGNPHGPVSGSLKCRLSLCRVQPTEDTTCASI